MIKKSSTFFEKHTKCCTLMMFAHNIYSHKDILYRRLQKKEELLNLDDFLGFSSKKSRKEKVVVATVAVTKWIKYFVARVRYCIQRRCDLKCWLVLCGLYVLS